jgi:hypothetical protein
MPLCKSELRNPNAVSSIRAAIENDNAYKDLIKPYKKFDLRNPDPKFVDKLPEDRVFAEIVDVRLRQIPLGGGYEVDLVRNDQGGGQDYASTHVGTIH